MTDNPDPLDDDGAVEVEATINLPRLRAGTRAMIAAAELDSDYVVACLEKGYIVIIGP